MPSPFRPTATSPDTTSRAVELLEELSQDHSWIELLSCLNCLDSNHWKLARRYRLNIHVTHSLEHLCCERRLMVKAEIEEFLRRKIYQAGQGRAGVTKLTKNRLAFHLWNQDRPARQT